MLATHADRKELFLKAGRQIVELCKRYYEQDDESVIPPFNWHLRGPLRKVLWASRYCDGWFQMAAFYTY